MKLGNVVKSTQEQAVAAWTAYLNQIHLERLLDILHSQDKNLSEAMQEIRDSMKKIAEEIEKNRGGLKGIHGFIAEAAEEGIGNAKANIVGKADVYELLDDNGPVDLVKNGVNIQMKFYNSGLSLNAIAKHFKKNPDYLEEGGNYQIPKDQYEKLCELRSISEEQAQKLGRSERRMWNSVNDFFKNEEIGFEKIESSELSYKDVQLGQIDKTMSREKNEILKTDREIREKARHENKANVKQGAGAAAASAGIEGGMTLLTAVSKKKKSGKAIRNFDSEDWIDIFNDTGLGTLKGTVRGVATYSLTGYYDSIFSAIPGISEKSMKMVSSANAAAVSAFVTAGFGVAQQAHLYRNGKVSEREFLENSEMLCIESTVSALSSFIGQMAIPVPILGAVLGNAIGTTLYQIAKDGLNGTEQKIIGAYLVEIDECGKMIDEQYKALIKSVSLEFGHFLEIIEALYSVNVKEAFEGSIYMAQYAGVPQEQILDTKEKIDSFFLD